MQLRGPDLRFELHLLSLPAHPTDWCKIEVVVERQGRRWERRDPSLRRCEVVKLAQWLEHLAEDAPQEQQGLAFMDAELALEYLPTPPDRAALRAATAWRV